MKKLSITQDLVKSTNIKAATAAFICQTFEREIEEQVKGIQRSEYKILSFKKGNIKVATTNNFVSSEILKKYNEIRRSIELSTKTKIEKIVFTAL